MSKRVSRKQYYSLRSFLSYMRRYKWRFLLVMFSFSLADLCLAVIPIFIGRLIGNLSARPLLGHSAVINVWILIILSSGHNILWRCSEILHMKLLNPMAYRYENILFKQVISKPYPYFVDKFTGKVSSYITTTTQELKTFFDDLTYNYTNEVVSLIAVTIILATVNWQTGVIFVIGLVLMFVVGRYSIRNSARYEKLSADTLSTKNAKVIDAIANFVNVKSFQKEAVEIRAIAREEEQVVTAATRSYKWTVFFWATMSFFVRDAIWPATIGFDVYLFLHGEITLTQLTTVLSTILIFSTTIWEIIWYISQFNLKLARIEEAHTYLFGPTNVVKEYYQAQARQSPTLQLNDHVALRHLHFAYPDKPDTPVLHDINLRLRKGEKLGVVGKSGSGKTTLTKLLLGYYQLKGDQLWIDDQAIDNRDLAQLISFVPQDTSLFHRSIAENIVYATDRKASQAAVIAAAKRAHAHEFITKISEGYEALVGERGVKLSAGQRQRIAIARAFLDDKPILILDEATSALDSESEVLVQEALEALWQHKTVIAIAHRLSTLRHMDRIIVLDKGRIVEEGSHQELLSQNGLYAEFWNHQSGGFIEE